MSCTRIESKLKAWIDGELSADEAGAVERHVDACPACRAKAADFRGISRLLREAEPTAAPAAPVASICERAVEARRDEDRIIRILQRVATAAAAILVVSAGLAIVPPVGGQPAGVPPAGELARESGVTNVDEDDALATFLADFETLAAVSTGGDR